MSNLEKNKEQEERRCTLINLLIISQHTKYKNMKNEDLRFSVYVESQNGQGEKQRTAINSFSKRSDVLRIAESLGINLNYNSPYQMRKEKMYLIEKPFIAKIWEYNFISIGEFRHEPLLCIKRLSKQKRYSCKP